MWKELKSRIAARLDQLFIPRELILRANDRITVLRLPVRAQKLCVLGTVLVFGWTLLASGGFFFQELVIAGKDREIERQKLDYFDLLGEAAEYHEQFAEITRNLEDNQTFLLSVLRDGARAEAEISAIEGRLKGSETERDRVVVASDGLRTKLRHFENDLQEIVNRNTELRSQVEAMRGILSDDRSKKERVAEARVRLGQRLQQIEQNLEMMANAKRQLEITVVDLREDIASTREQWAAAEEVGVDLREEIIALEGQLESDLDRRDGLQRQIAALEESLENATQRGDVLQEDKQGLQTRVAELRQHMTDMRAAQHSIVQRLRDRTELSVDSIERTVAMTGLELDDLLAGIEETGIAQGGPFVAGDYSGDFNGDSELETALSLLDLRLSRWNALQKVMRTLPLSVPLDQYAISSGYGKRKDPINGRTAYHRGLDFRAAMRSPIFATAPGTVTYAGWSGPFGRMVEIDHGHGIRTRYAHLKKILVKSGQAVANREKIGLVGSSGRSTGPHLHYEVRYKGVPLNPMKFLTAGKHVFKD